MDAEQFQRLVKEVGGEDDESELGEGLCLHVEINGEKRVSLGFDRASGRVLMMICLSEIDPDDFGDVLWGQLLLRNAYGMDRLSTTEDSRAIMLVRALPSGCDEFTDMLGEAAELCNKAEDITRDLVRYAKPREETLPGSAGEITA